MNFSKWSFIILFIRNIVLANENSGVEYDRERGVELEMPVEIINNYLMRYFLDKKVFLSFITQASDYNEHEKQTEIIDGLYTKSIYTHFSHINADIEKSLTLSNQLPFLSIFIDGITSFM